MRGNTPTRLGTSRHSYALTRAARYVNTVSTSIQQYSCRYNEVSSRRPRQNQSCRFITWEMPSLVFKDPNSVIRDTSPFTLIASRCDPTQETIHSSGKIDSHKSISKTVREPHCQTRRAQGPPDTHAYLSSQYHLTLMHPSPSPSALRSPAPLRTRPRSNPACPAPHPTPHPSIPSLLDQPSKSSIPRLSHPRYQTDCH